MHYLFDTNHASAHWQGHAKLTPRVLAATPDTRFSLCLPSIGELWFMVFNSSRVTENEARLHEFLLDFDHRPYDAAAAIEFGRIKTELRTLGPPIPNIDVQIAAIARARDLTILTADT